MTRPDGRKQRGSNWDRVGNQTHDQPVLRRYEQRR